MSNLDKVNFESMLNSNNAPFKKSEKTKMMRVKASVYDELKKRAYENNTKMNHELDNLVREAYEYEKEHNIKR